MKAIASPLRAPIGASSSPSRPTFVLDAGGCRRLRRHHEIRRDHVRLYGVRSLRATASLAHGLDAEGVCLSLRQRIERNTAGRRASEHGRYAGARGPFPRLAGDNRSRKDALPDLDRRRHQRAAARSGGRAGGHGMAGRHAAGSRRIAHGVDAAHPVPEQEARGHGPRRLGPRPSRRIIAPRNSLKEINQRPAHRRRLKLFLGNAVSGDHGR